MHDREEYRAPRKRTGNFRIYKKLAAASFGLIPVRHNDSGHVSKNGAVLVEVAPGVGKQQWDWKQKIIFAIGIQDICNLISQDQTKHRLFHDHGGTPKALEFKPGQGRHEGTFMLVLSEGKGSSRRSVSVPLDSGEYQVLMRLLLGAVSSLIGWDL